MHIAEVTNYMKPQTRQVFSHNASSPSGITKFYIPPGEGIEPQNIPYCTGSRISFSGNQYRYIHQRRECIGVLGSKSVAGYRIEFNGTWENQTVPIRGFQGVEETTRKYGGLVVGLIHSRGVNRVMPIESQQLEALEKGSAV